MKELIPPSQEIVTIHVDVIIHIDGKPVRIRPGRHTVVEIKKLGSVPGNFVLDQLVECKLVPLPDDGTVSVKGCEEFFSQPNSGGTS